MILASHIILKLFVNWNIERKLVYSTRKSFICYQIMSIHTLLQWKSCHAPASHAENNPVVWWYSIGTFSDLTTLSLGNGGYRHSIYCSIDRIISVRISHCMCMYHSTISGNLYYMYISLFRTGSTCTFKYISLSAAISLILYTTYM